MVTTRYFDQRERLTENPEVFGYDDLPQDFRYKVAYVLEDLYEFLAGKLEYDSQLRPYRLWERQIVRALGISTPPRSVTDYFVSQDVSEFFIGIEVALEAAADCLESAYSTTEWRSRVSSSMDEFNKLLLYYALGYEIVLSRDKPLFQVIRKDTEFTHTEMVKPVLRLLIDDEFEHADKQFRDAHREFQQGNYDDAITDASAAVETVFKVVLGIDEGNAKELLKAAGDAGYIPSYLESSTGQWVNLLLELPTVRNKYGDAHGKGKTQPDEREMERLARMALNLAATHILFIVDKYRRRGASL